MQFNTLTIVLASMTSLASAQATVTVYACESSSTLASGVASSTGFVASYLNSPVTSGVAAPSGAAAATGTVASVAVVSTATAATSPIAYATGAASMNGVSAFGMLVAGGVALLI